MSALQVIENAEGVAAMWCRATAYGNLLSSRRGRFTPVQRASESSIEANHARISSNASPHIENPR